MREKSRPEPDDHAYTGETIVLPQRRRSAGPAPRPAPPSRARRPLWPLVRRGLLAALALAILLLLLFYIQILSAASRIVVDDARSNRPVASPLAGGVNLLIVGVDERPDHPEEGVRSDTLILVRLDSAGRWANMLSIPRDTLASIPDLGETKINVAYGHGYANAAALYGPGTTPQQGGMTLAAETVERFLDLPGRGQRVDYVMQINFDGFAKIVDALGGVTIDVPQLIVDDAYPTPDFGTRRVEFQPGVQRMDGATALIYARTRHADSDFGRAERQQQVVRAIVDEVRRRGALGQALLLPRLLGGLEGSVTTTLPFGRLDVLAGLGWLASGLSPDEVGRFQISPETVPNYQEIGSDLVWDPAGVGEVVGAFLTRPSEADEAATVQVFNATGRAGLAGSVTGELEQAGFTVLPADNAPTDDVQKTVVYDVAGKPLTSRRLAERLDAELRQGAPPEGVASGADIVVILGQDAVVQ
jgi:LCP family protein required for cell wall assembly